MTASKTVLATLILFRSVRVTTLLFFFFFNDTATTEIYTLSLHDALPIWGCSCRAPSGCHDTRPPYPRSERDRKSTRLNSSHVRISYAVFCLKKKKNKTSQTSSPPLSSPTSNLPTPDSCRHTTTSPRTILF